jgi:Methyltransferase domain
MTSIATRLPAPVKSTLKVLQKKIMGTRLAEALGLPALQNIILARLGIANEFSAYEDLLNYVEANHSYELPGDFLEIGAFMGGGSARLAKYASQHNKGLIVIDLFDPSFDDTPNVRGQSMSSLYRRALGRKNQREIFDSNTRQYKNIVVYAEDSAKVKLPPETQLCFSYLDGGHDPEYVKSDFYLAWNKTVSGGAVAFHDYVESGGDLPQVTDAINGLIATNKSAIRDTYYFQGKAMILISKQ